MKSNVAEIFIQCLCAVMRIPHCSHSDEILQVLAKLYGPLHRMRLLDVLHHIYSIAELQLHSENRPNCLQQIAMIFQTYVCFPPAGDGLLLIVLRIELSVLFRINSLQFLHSIYAKLQWGLVSCIVHPLLQLG